MQDKILLIIIALGFLALFCLYSNGVMIDKIINFYQNIGKNKKAIEALKRSIESDRKNNRLK
ncbi:TPA: hypothetical protein N6U39_004666 [Escherichia coli]|uniref:hypothetical protein n=1 Tax=Gammaproteobacteria TaxID=1236 RepID=UPI000F8FE836|nr:hypothetical protein [Vibrio cholerae]ECA8457343.1 hypothetical protein [Salmonella enterica subsp. enterica serovar Kentucky]EFL2682484.1 hypothetical protein [Escherichia coli]MKK13005.1 hypothetical protein [Salmonella enterica subsp. enterica serovar Newport]MCN2380862.1 hypothetical protein [Escherichia coli]MDV2301144.1 hypothetical protein [Vibrio cholerae]